MVLSMTLDGKSREELGSVRDPVLDREVTINKGQRVQHLLVTDGHVLDVNIYHSKQTDDRAILHITGVVSAKSRDVTYNLYGSELFLPFCYNFPLCTPI